MFLQWQLKSKRAHKLYLFFSTLRSICETRGNANLWIHVLQVQILVYGVIEKNWNLKSFNMTSNAWKIIHIQMYLSNNFVQTELQFEYFYSFVLVACNFNIPSKKLRLLIKRDGQYKSEIVHLVFLESHIILLAFCD